VRTVWLVGLLGLTASVTARTADVSPPAIPARAYLLVESRTGTELATHNPDQRLPPASLTKLMTAYLLFGDLRSGRLRLDEPVMVSREAARLPGARMFLTAGEVVTVENLLQGMLVQSGNDATRALVEHVSGDQRHFVARMNAEAARLGMLNTCFVNVGGLHHHDHYSSARDLARLAIALRNEYPEYRYWFAQRDFTWAGIHQANRNRLLRDPSVDGLKTGHTEAAGFNLIASSERNDMQLIAVVLGADSEEARAQAGRRLLAHGYQHFETRIVQAAGPLLNLPIWQGERDAVPIGVADDIRITLARGGFAKLASESVLPANPSAPVTRGQTLGRLFFRLDDRVIVERPLVALEDVPEGNLLKRVGDRLRQWMSGGSVAMAGP